MKINKQDIKKLIKEERKEIELKKEIKRINKGFIDRVIWKILPNTQIGIKNWNEQEIERRKMEIKLIKTYQKKGVRF